MADVKINPTTTPREQADVGRQNNEGRAEGNVRGEKARARLRMLAEKRPKNVSVSPKNQKLRERLVHPHGHRFPKEGPASWPDDVFTQRRIADGSVKLEQ